jgi:hypothetical protein
VKSLASIVWEAQTVTSNLLAESVITFGVKSFGLEPLVPDVGYLPLYEKMIQGIFDYEATYTRLLYSAQVNESTPSSCMRPVNGFADLQLFGWSPNPKAGIYLLPITFINLTTLVILVVAMCTIDKGVKLLPLFDPTDPESLILSHDETGELLRLAMAQPTDHAAWSTVVGFGQNKSGIRRLWPYQQVKSI